MSEYTLTETIKTDKVTINVFRPNIGEEEQKRRHAVINLTAASIIKDLNKGR